MFVNLPITVYLIDADYSGLYNVTFPAGVTSVPFNISIYDIEDNENFTLIINTDSLPGGIIAGSPNKVTVIMRNDDSKCTQCMYVTTTMLAI